MAETDRIHFMQWPELKPCPFCGNTDRRSMAVHRRVYGENDGKSHPELDGEVYWYVECLCCDARTRDCWDGDIELECVGHLFKDGREWAIHMWNMRKEPRYDEQGT